MYVSKVADSKRIRPDVSSACMPTPTRSVRSAGRLTIEQRQAVRETIHCCRYTSSTALRIIASDISQYKAVVAMWRCPISF